MRKHIRCADFCLFCSWTKYGGSFQSSGWNNKMCYSLWNNGMCSGSCLVSYSWWQSVDCSEPL